MTLPNWLWDWSGKALVVVFVAIIGFFAAAKSDESLNMRELKRKQELTIANAEHMKALADGAEECLRVTMRAETLEKPIGERINVFNECNHRFIMTQ